MTEPLALTLSIIEADPADPDAMRMIGALSDSLAEITGDSGRSSFDPDDVRGNDACFILARDAQGQAVGCGAYRFLDDGIAEIKRMYAKPGTSGVGAAMLAYLEVSAKGKGYAQCQLETRRVNERAIIFYRKHGYQEIASYGKYVGRAEAICFGKELI
jgi:ribosomal protein S18 acetylase RimI-like enzyme